MEMTINSEFLRELRAKANWSQEDLAAASGLSLRTIQRVEKDGSAALETRKALAAAFGLRPEQLDGASQGYDPIEVRIGTGLLAVWIGIAWFFDLGWGIGLLGVGGVYLIGQAWRVLLRGMSVLWEMIAVGVVCSAAGAATLLGFELRIGAVILVGIGCLMIFSAGRLRQR